MNYDHQIDNALNALHSEGRYRIFQDISRINGQYPKANWVKTDGTQSEITVWCGNDYLGMGQSPEVISALKKSIDSTGVGSGGTRNISGNTIFHKELEKEARRVVGLIPNMKPGKQRGKPVKVTFDLPITFNVQ